MRDVNDEARQFWAEKERERGGKIGFYTFATYLGMSLKRSVTLGGLIYTVDEKIYFEDFEKENWLIKLVGKKQKYEKTEFSINIREIVEVKIVSKGTALNCISGYIGSEETRPLSPMLQVFSKPVVQIRLNNGSSLFFEIMRQHDFVKAIEEVRVS